LLFLEVQLGKHFLLWVVLFDGHLGNLNGALSAPSSSDEASSMNKLSVGDSSDLAELFTSESSHGLADRHSVIELTKFGWQGLNSRHVSSVLVQSKLDVTLKTVLLLDIEEMLLPWASGLEPNELFWGVELFSGIPGFLHDLSSWHDYVDDSIKFEEEFLLHDLHGLLELDVLAISCVLWSVPGWVVTRDSLRKIGFDVVSRLICYVDTVVDGVNLKEQVLIHFGENMLDLILSQIQVVLRLASVLDNFLAEVFPDKTGWTQLGGGWFDLFGFCSRLFVFFLFLLHLFNPPVVLKCLLMMIKSVVFRVEDSSNIALNVQLVENVLVTSSDDDTVLELVGSQ
jgi:hypothetical protein